MSEIAYAKRNIKLIAIREKINFLYKVFRKLLRILFRHQNKITKSISTYPKIEDREELIDLVNRLAWAYPYKENLKINIFVSKELVVFDLKLVKEVRNQRNYLYDNISHICLVEKFINKSDLIYVTRAKKIFFLNPFYLCKTEILDKEYFSSVEGELLQNGYSRVLSGKEKEKLERLSLENYSRMIEKNKNKNKAYCFVTGPSFDRYKEFNYEDNSLKVICNSTVKNDEFLEYIGGPDLLAFADPVFHFSPSEYSAVFRDEVVKVYKKYKPYIIVPFDTVGLLLAHYPEFEDRLIGMKGQKEPFNFPTINSLWIKVSANILTLYMLPVASSLADEINVIGADGRNPDENYFWKHSKSAQFGNLMNTVFETHPSFFRDRDYKDYYDEHCEFLNGLIIYGESIGKKYLSLTQSYIPALKERYNND